MLCNRNTDKAFNTKLMKHLKISYHGGTKTLMADGMDYIHII